jgi:hypothetical protein
LHRIAFKFAFSGKLLFQFLNGPDRLFGVLIEKLLSFALFQGAETDRPKQAAVRRLHILDSPFPSAHAELVENRCDPARAPLDRCRQDEDV